MFRCEECGSVFEEPDRWKEDRGEHFGFPAYETMSGCPFCHGDYEELKEEDENDERSDDE